MRVTDRGIERNSLDEYRDQIIANMRARLGTDLADGADTVQGQIATVFALAMAQNDEAGVAVANGMSLFTARGAQLDALGSLVDLRRLRSRNVTVLLRLRGTDGTVVPSGSLVSVGGKEFVTQREVEIPGSTLAVARDADTRPPVANATWQIVSTVAGWNNVVNEAAGEPARARETDVQFRIRYLQRLQMRNLGTAQAIQAEVIGVPGVADCQILVRDEPGDGTEDRGFTLPGHSITCIVRAESTGYRPSEEVARAIFGTKPAGIRTYGGGSGNETTRTISYGREGAGSVIIRFAWVQEVPVKISFTLVEGSAFPAGGEQLIKSRIMDWLVGNWSEVDEASPLEIGQAISTSRILAPILSVLGHTVVNNMVTIRFKGSPAPTNRGTVTAPNRNVLLVVEDAADIAITRRS